jgi:hypothetical protein
VLCDTDYVRFGELPELAPNCFPDRTDNHRQPPDIRGDLATSTLDLLDGYSEQN